MPGGKKKGGGRGGEGGYQVGKNRQAEAWLAEVEFMTTVYGVPGLSMKRE